VHGLLGHDGIPPAELLARGRAEVIGYGGEIRQGEVIAARRDGDGFVVGTAGGETITARRLLVTTGLVDELPDVPGLRERWGRDVLHCPYCHGWEVRDQAIGVLATGPMSVHQALLFSQLSDDVVLFGNEIDLPADQLARTAAAGVEVVEGRVTGVEVTDDRLSGLRMADGRVIARQAIAVATRMVARADFLGELGVEVAEHPSGMGVHVVADQTGATGVPGVWAAGNVVDLSAQVGASAAAGALAGAVINADLVNADVDRVLAGSLAG
jgi:thioredoxin reductase